MTTTAFHQNTLPTIDDFVAVARSFRDTLSPLYHELSESQVRRVLRTFLESRRAAYFGAAADTLELERRRAVWERERMSGLFAR